MRGKEQASRGAILSNKSKVRAMVEFLKKFQDVTNPDPRYEFFHKIDRSTGSTRPITLEDIYSDVAKITLHAGVPDEIRSHFATSLNLLVYSWFYYPFGVAAHFNALVTIESALKKLFNEEKHVSFARLIEKAVKNGLVKDSGFSMVRDQHRYGGVFGQDPEIDLESIEPYVTTLIKALPALRNSLAHGTYMLHPNGFPLVKICAEFINQLFTKKTNK